MKTETQQRVATFVTIVGWFWLLFTLNPGREYRMHAFWLMTAGLIWLLCIYGESKTDS